MSPVLQMANDPYADHVASFKARGLRAVWLGKCVAQMTQDEIIAYVGFLDALLDAQRFAPLSSTHMVPLAVAI